MKNHAHRDRSIVPTDPRMRSYWKYHVDGTHRVPREGVRSDHFYACSWCLMTPRWSERQRYEYADGEWEQFYLPQSAAADPMAAIAGRMG